MHIPAKLRLVIFARGLSTMAASCKGIHSKPVSHPQAAACLNGVAVEMVVDMGSIKVALWV
jgi:predicted aspartyl protease